MEAKDCKCIECGKQAVAFWPVIDPDIPSHPYCRACLDKVKVVTLMEVFNYSEEDAENFVKHQNAFYDGRGTDSDTD